MATSNSLKQTFDEVALLYNEARPRYPAELFSTLIDIVHLDSHAKLLEIGPGTGQATRPLAQKGFSITGVEPGSSLAAVARRELAAYKNVQVLNVSFEDAILPSKSFDLVFAATSFHWIDPSKKYLKTSNVLKDNGHLAIIHTNHISDEEGDIFFNEAQPIYDQYGYTDKHQKPALPKNNELRPDELDQDLFSVIHFQVFPVVINYTARKFVQLLNTYSNHLASEKKTQKAFYNAIEYLINEKFQGRIDKHFSMSLTVAKKR